MVADSVDIGDTSGALRKTPSRELELESTPPPEAASTERVPGTEFEEETSWCGQCIKRGRFTTFDALFLIGGMAMYIADITTDVLVGIQYYRNRNHEEYGNDYLLWSIMTFVFIIVPSVVLQYFSFRWFVSDVDVDVDHQKKGWFGKLWSWCVWLVMHLLQLGALKRYWRTLKYGLKSRKDERYSRLMLYEYRDITMLRLLEAFMESAPQLVLQVYIMVSTEDLYWLTACSAIVSLGSLSWALELYHKALRDSRADRADITYPAVILRMVWRLFTITARVLAMALFASIYKWWLFVVAGVHWLLMTLWLIWQETDFCDTKFEEVLFDAVMAIVHIFCFFNMKEGRTRFRALTFYIVIFLENTLMFGLWYREQESREQMYGLPALVFVWGGFFLGLLTMSMYYLHCHPSGAIPLCVCTLTEEEASIDEKEIPPERKGVAAGAPRGALPAEASTRNFPVGTDEVDGGPSQNGLVTKVTCKCPGRGEYYVNLFSYRSRRQIHPRLLASLTGDDRCECVITQEPASSLANNVSPVHPEMIDTHAVCRVDSGGHVFTNLGADDTAL